MDHLKAWVIKRVTRIGSRIAVQYMGKDADGLSVWFDSLTPAVIQGGIEVITPGVLVYKRQVTVEKVLADLSGHLAATGDRSRLEIVEVDPNELRPSFGPALPGLAG